MAKVYAYAKFGGPEVEHFADLPIPVPGAGELLVRMRAAGVNPADWKLRANYHNLPNAPTGETPMGREAAGVVEAVGEGVEGFSVGDRVFGIARRNGGWSEYPVLSVDEAALIPDGVSFRDAATLSVASATAFDGITQLNPGPGEIVLISGAGGGVGLAAMQMAQALGAAVIGTASAAKQELVESFGAGWVAYGDGEADRVRALAPDGVDAFLDNIGSASLRPLIGVVKDPARAISAASRELAVELGGSLQQRNRNSATLRLVAEMVADGRLKPHVTDVFPLDRIGDALALVEAGHATGKVIVELD